MGERLVVRSELVAPGHVPDSCGAVGATRRYLPAVRAEGGSEHWALVAAKQFGDAATVLGATVADYERVAGIHHPDTLGAREELAAAHHAAGQFADAARLYRRTLADREHAQGAHHPDTIATRQKLADTYLAGGHGARYMDSRRFAEAGVRVLYQAYSHPVYAQQHGDFVPFLSSLDLLLMHGDASLAILRRGDAWTEEP